MNTSLSVHLEKLDDPRKNIWLRRHDLKEVVIMAICGVLCGADSFEDIELFAKCKKDWLGTFLSLPNGIPSHDTFSRIFARLNPVQFRDSFLSWTQSLGKSFVGEVIAIDGKTVRGSFDKSSGAKAIHMVSAWACANHIVLGQIKVDEKSNEITAIPKLLDLLDIKGCLITIDAMGTQKEIANKIISGEGDYILALKGNQGTLHEDIKLAFDGATPEKLTERTSDFHETVEKAHGRIETRRYWISDDIEWLSQSKAWVGFNSIGIVESIREEGEKVSYERRYFLCSIEPIAKRLAQGVRGHWGVENNLHWVLDVIFNEDKSRIRTGHASENFNTLRKLSMAMIKQDKSKGSLKGKRKRAGWDTQFLMNLLLSRAL